MLVRRFAAIAALLCAGLLALRPPAAPVSPQPAARSASTATTSVVPVGAVLVPIRLTDPAVGSLLRRGDEVDLYAGEPGLPLQLIGAGLLVAEVRAEENAGIGSGGGGPLVVLATDPAAAADVAAVAGSGLLVVTLGPRHSRGIP